MNTLSFKLQTLIQSELRPTERMQWSASPSPGRLARKCLPIVLFAIPWTAFSVFWIAGASGFKMPDFSSGSGLFPLFGLPFLLIGIGMFASPFLAAKKARRSAYVVTNERAIIFESGFWGSISIRSFLPHQLQEIRRVQRSDGSGDLILERQLGTNNDGGRTTTEIGFFGIPDVKSVESMVMNLGKH